MSERVLTVDVGNSRTKLVVFEPASAAGRASDSGVHDRDAASHPHGRDPKPQPYDRDATSHPHGRDIASASPGRVVESAALANGPALGRELEAWLASRGGLARCVSSSVVSPELELTVTDVLRRAFGTRFAPAPDPGLVLCVSAPETVGRDRLHAARAAFAVAGGPAVVVNAGTALTVDVVGYARAGRWIGRAEAAAGVDAGRDDGASAGRARVVAADARDADAIRAAFGGGAIAAGPRLAADALARHTARLPLVEPHVGAAAWGRDTLSALQAGVVVGFRGAARELASRVARESGLCGVPVVVTGGARAFLLEPDPCFDGNVLEDEHLVPRGLFLAAVGAGAHG